MVSIRSFIDKTLEQASLGATHDEDFREGCASILFVLILIMVGLTISRRDECDVEPMIPIWIIVVGSCMLVTSIIEFLRRRHKTVTQLPTHENEDAPKIQRFPFPLALLHFSLNIFSIFWFFIGCYWVYHAYPNRSMCDFYIFNIAFGLILCVGAVLFVILCLSICYILMKK